MLVPPARIKHVTLAFVLELPSSAFRLLQTLDLGDCVDWAGSYTLSTELGSQLLCPPNVWQECADGCMRGIEKCEYSAGRWQDCSDETKGDGHIKIGVVEL